MYIYIYTYIYIYMCVCIYLYIYIKNNTRLSGCLKTLKKQANLFHK